MIDRLIVLANCAMRADAIAALVRVQPKLTQEPPRYFRSVNPTRFPALADLVIDWDNLRRPASGTRLAHTDNLLSPARLASVADSSL
jgi:hypothetical protein